MSGLAAGLGKAARGVAEMAVFAIRLRWGYVATRGYAGQARPPSLKRWRTPGENGLVGGGRAGYNWGSCRGILLVGRHAHG